MVRRYGLASASLLALLACSGGSEPTPSGVVTPTPVTGALPASRTVASFEGTFDPTSGAIEITSRGANGATPEATPPWGTTAGDLYFHTCSVSYSSTTLTGGVTAINLLSGSVQGLTAVIDSISESGVTLGTGTVGATSGEIASYGTVAVNTVNCTSPMTWTFDLPGPTAFSFTGHASITEMGPIVISETGSDQTFTVPTGFTQVTAKLWGAGGGGGNQGGSGAGFTEGTIAVTGGEVLTLIVGQAGYGANKATTTPYGGGGAGALHVGSWNGAAAGGGRSAVRVSGTEILTAGGGGGGGDAAPAGAGGGASGLVGSGTSGGGGGTQSTGGTGVASSCDGYGPPPSGSQFQGGNSYTGDPAGHWGAGAGGGGWYGGAAGGYTCGQWGAGGGGSGYIGGAGVSAGTTLAGSGATPANSSDSDHASGIGAGGAANGTGGNGLIVLYLM